MSAADANAALRERTTTLIAESSARDGPLEDLLPIVYGELQRMARSQLRREEVGHTLRTMDLVHEAYLRLVDQTRVTAKGRAYFFAAAARAMRQVLIDHARMRLTEKRGKGERLLSIDDVEVAVDQYAEELLDLDRALESLKKLSARQEQVIECRFFGGLSVEETASALGVSPRTVNGDWLVARAWLQSAMDDDAS